MPIASTYKGVAIFAGQPAKRVRLVKGEIDKIGKISDLEELFEIAGARRGVFLPERGV